MTVQASWKDRHWDRTAVCAGLDKLAQDYVAVIEELSPDEPVHVLAHDWGSIAMWEVVCRPDARRL